MIPVKEHEFRSFQKIRKVITTKEWKDKCRFLCLSYVYTTFKKEKLDFKKIRTWMILWKASVFLAMIHEDCCSMFYFTTLTCNKLKLLKSIQNGSIVYMEISLKINSAEHANHWRRNRMALPWVRFKGLKSIQVKENKFLFSPLLSNWFL